MSIEDVIATAVQEALTKALPDALARVERPAAGIDPNTVYTLPEAAKRLKMSLSTLRTLKDNGHIRYFATTQGGRIFITEENCCEFLRWRAMHWDAYTKGMSYPQLPAKPLEVAA